jgi:NADH-quinone oxidoreductase subunit L
MGLLIGIAILFGASGTFRIAEINAWATSGKPSHTVLLWAAIALFIACIGKSGQFPLHTWLPDAMAGPTPVSSLLHSSTMVVAGVFLVARLYPVFFEGLKILDTNVNLIAVIGGVTIIVAALLAFVQNDIKKVLAYSTVSQLGYMMMGLGVGAWTPAVFHIWTHAFFKCCLFLCAGSVAHSGSHHSFDMKKDMGGLWRKMPVTFVCWVISSMALAGVPLFSGWFSKDEIISTAGANQYKVFMIVGLVGAFLTTAYMTRATYLTFLGTPRGAAAGEHHDEHGDADADSHAPAHGHPADHDHGDVADHHDAGHGEHLGAHESPWLIKFPIIVLAVLAIFAGLLNAAPFKIHKFEDWVEPKAVPVALATATPQSGGTEAAAGYPGGRVTSGELTGPCGTPGFQPTAGETCYAPGVVHHEFKWIDALPAFLLVLAGFAVSALVCVGLYGRRNRRLVGLTQRNALARGVYALLWNKYYLDALYENVIVRGIAHPLAKAMYWINQNIFDGVVNGVGRTGRKIGEFTYRYIDQGAVDGVVNGSGSAARGAGTALRPTQSGKVSQYGALLFGAAALAALILVLVNS